MIIAEWSVYLAILPEFYGQEHVNSITITDTQNPWGWRYLGDEHNAFFIEHLDDWETDTINGHPVYFYINDMFAKMNVSA